MTPLLVCGGKDDRRDCDGSVDSDSPCLGEAVCDAEVEDGSLEGGVITT
jgi:hypothetical protein